MMMMDLCRPTSTLGQAGINTGATGEPLLTGSSQIFDINVIFACISNRFIDTRYGINMLAIMTVLVPRIVTN